MATTWARTVVADLADAQPLICVPGHRLGRLLAGLRLRSRG
jgi:hypothetical protein